ncbi:prolipoprotein diacylglyceryl transferase [Mangrovactinospora gilvigrisea]|uniref:Phosphatidylglycerol--prolipoprotein diacylglyceryl transferase n=1 Tax=Mangrovactinospora gilvigrisea TaxID=1428644 RepID=A0A1J7BAH1_9ACTN|nr:prolipoprotein diacylglyceryl transferase [Mangrovactinospora gilvigrisea]OIV35597.1 prolipoprotein diacylglyceryl transferase [Mangrovactinospora gilvigrisea]
MNQFAYIPSPSIGYVTVGPLKLHAYALCIIIGVVIAVWVGSRRWVARGGRSTTVGDIALWAVPFGLVGGRLYHVITDYELYFGAGRDWVGVFKIWDGGLGIWGAVALGSLGAWLGCRRRGIPLPAWIDAVAPGLAFAQAIGRWGNWFNQELFGSPSKLPWAVEIAPGRPGTVPGHLTYQPTFLYECIWDIGVGFLVLWADRKWKLGHGRAFALYAAAYCVGRGIVEHMRIDYAHHFLGLRLNDWTAIVVFVAAAAYFLISLKKRPGREEIIEPDYQLPKADAAAGAAEGTAKDADEGAETADAAEDDEDLRALKKLAADDEDEPEPESAKDPAEAEKPAGH